MTTHQEYLNKLRELKEDEEATMTHLLAIRMDKALTWAEMNKAIGDELKPKPKVNLDRKETRKALRDIKD